MKVPGYSYEAFCRGIVERDGPGCFVAALLKRRRAEHSVDYSPGLLECRGEMDGHHAGIRKNRLKQEVPADRLAVALSDPRNGLLVCRRHHDLLERGLVVLRREDLPLCVDEFAAEFGLEGWLDRYVGRRREEAA